MSILLPSILDAYNASCFMHDDRFDSHGNATHNAAVWTTELSEAVFPGICHSHNDYWRPHPLFSALSVGCASVEADVWLSPDGEDILVGHDKRSLAPSRTLRSLYIDLLLEVLDRVNLRSTADSTGQAHGVFSTEPNTTLILFIDVKDDPAKTWPLVLQQLGPLRDKRYLSRHDRTMNTNQSFWNGPITIVGTGNIVKRRDVNIGADLEQWQQRHDAFFDAPLHLLTETGFANDAEFRNASEYENEFFTASAPFRKAIDSDCTRSEIEVKTMGTT
ncbi:altered inheritance of mitochondria protein 6 [Fusarium flagelliforme]|uniref:Altered inheritance of mitochondria protein 6 n=1 Tax=Fusarium flagelliforme TaxID=2675880 RepID=A0A395MGI9_9HYPO|nr:altered inheritance of mitochondria protein 6 [Fusarium flagelliforme]